MKFNILSQQAVIGVLPADRLLSGSADLHDVLNSWAMYVHASVLNEPTHLASVLFNSAMIDYTNLLQIADGFNLVSEDPLSIYDDVITFKGQEYYVTDYATDTASRGNCELAIRLKSVVDAETAADATESYTENLDAIFTFTSGLVQQRFQSIQFSQQVRQPVQGSVADVAAPAFRYGPVAPVGNLVPPVVYGQVSSSYQTAHVVPDVQAAKLALANLLAKGSL